MASGTEVHGVQHTQVKVENTGRPATVRDTYHSWANHFTKNSCSYFPHRRLYRYINFYRILRLAFLSWLLCFLGGLPSLNEESYKEVPAYCFIPIGIWIAVFCQHEFVSRQTLPFVLQQPVINEQRKINTFYRVTVRELNGIALANYQAGLGYLQLTEGKVEFQAFNPRAVELMNQARCSSRLYLFLFIISAVYNFYFLFTYSVKI